MELLYTYDWADGLSWLLGFNSRWTWLSVRVSVLAFGVTEPLIMSQDIFDLPDVPQVHMGCFLTYTMC